MATKDWKKTANFRRLINYKNKRTGAVIIIEKPDDNSKWTITRGDGSRLESLSNTKQIALKKARSYMRTH